MPKMVIILTQFLHSSPQHERFILEKSPSPTYPIVPQTRQPRSDELLGKNFGEGNPALARGEIQEFTKTVSRLSSSTAKTITGHKNHPGSQTLEVEAFCSVVLAAVS